MSHKILFIIFVISLTVLAGMNLYYINLYQGTTEAYNYIKSSKEACEAKWDTKCGLTTITVNGIEFLEVQVLKE